MFPPVYLDDMVLVDGGVFTNLDLNEAISKCREHGFADEDIIVDVVMCFDKEIKVEDWPKNEFKYKNAYEVFDRKTQYIDFYYYYEDITRVIRGYPKVEFRHLIVPTTELGGGFIPIFDDIEQIKFLLAQGEKDARRSLNDYLQEFPDKALKIPQNET